MSADAGPPAPSAGCRLIVEGSPRGVRRALGQMMRALGPLALNPAAAGAVELVLAEALNNVVEHAYAGRGGRIVLDCQPAADGIHVILRDRGIAMPGGRVPPAGPARASGGSDSGFGWDIIRQIAEEITYRREGGENLLMFRVPLVSGTSGSSDSRAPTPAGRPAPAP